MLGVVALLIPMQMRVSQVLKVLIRTVIAPHVELQTIPLTFVGHARRQRSLKAAIVKIAVGMNRVEITA